MSFINRRYRKDDNTVPAVDSGGTVEPVHNATQPTTISQEQLDDMLGRNGSYMEDFVPKEMPVGEQFKAQKAAELNTPAGNAEGTVVQPSIVSVQPQQTGQSVNVTIPAENAAGTTATQAQPAQQPYLADWSKGFNNVMFGVPAKDGQEEIKGQNIPILQAIVDYNRWAKENKGEELDPFTLYSLYSQHGDMTKSIEDNKKAEKRKQMEDMFEQLGYLLTNTGNFVGAALGAPAPANAPDSVELTARQRKLREYTDQQRKTTAKDLLTILRQKQADERAAELQKIRERQQDRYDREQQRKEEDQERKNALAQAQIKEIEARTEKREEEAKYWKAYVNAIYEGDPLPVAEGKANVAYKQALAEKMKNSVTSGGSKNSSSSKRSSGSNTNLETVTISTKEGDTTTRRTYKQQRGGGMSNFSIHNNEGGFSIHNKK